MFRPSLNRLRSLLPGARSAAEAAPAQYQVPPFTEDVVEAVRLISTRLALKADERSRLLFQAESNDASMVEYEALKPLFDAMPKPRKVLEVGPGLGRSLVVFSKLGVWTPDAELHAYDTTGSATKYKQEHYDRPPQWPDVSSFCGNLPLLATVLDYNGVRNYRVVDAATQPLSSLPGPYGLIYGFYSIGFHWSLEHYLDDLAPLMNEHTVLVCTLNKHFRPFPALKNYAARVLESPRMKKGARPLSFLAVSKGALPEVGRHADEAFT